MNKTVIGGIVGVIVIGIAAILILNLSGTNNGTVLQNNDPGNTISRPAVQAIPNTFSIMTPEEKAASEEAARIRAESALQASSTGTSTDVDTDVEVEVEVEEETN
jgi:hypothetical protein